MPEFMTLRQIIERDGACVAVFRKDPVDGDVPVYASGKYPPAKKHADDLATATGVEHVAVLVIGFGPVAQADRAAVS